MLLRLVVVLAVCLSALSLRAIPSRRVAASRVSSQSRVGSTLKPYGAGSGSPLGSRRDEMGVTALGMGVLDDIKKIVAGGDPNEVLAAENDEIIGKYKAVVDKVNALEEKFEQLSDDELKVKTEQFREDIKKGASLDSLLVEAFAVVSIKRFSHLFTRRHTLTPIHRAHFLISHTRSVRRLGECLD